MKSKSQRKYTHVATFLAPQGAYFAEGGYLFPVAYISVWKDSKGFHHHIPVFQEELSSDDAIYDDMDDTIDSILNDGERSFTLRMTCKEFLSYIAKSDRTKDSIARYMEEICDYVISGEIATTPEVLDYFRNGEWGDLSTLQNDGSLYGTWLVDFYRQDQKESPSRP